MEYYLKLEWVAFRDFLSGIYLYIFPEYPAVGALVGALTFLIFIFYLIKGGFSYAFKLAVGICFALTLFLFSVHQLGKLFILNLTF